MYVRPIVTAYCKVQRHSAVSCAKTAEPIEMPFGIWIWVGPRKHVLVGDKPFLCGGNAVFCQITLSTYYYY